MKQFLCFLVIFLCIFSTVRAANGTESLKFQTFIEETKDFIMPYYSIVEGFEELSKTMNIEAPDGFIDAYEGFENADGLLEWFAAFADFLKAQFKNLLIVGEYVIYAVKYAIAGLVVGVDFILSATATAGLRLIYFVLFMFGYVPDIPDWIPIA